MREETFKNIKKYFEIFFISFAFIGAGYLIESKDPCLFFAKINFSLFMISLLTLFYGESGLLIFLALCSLSCKLFYDSVPAYHFLQMTALGILLYLFYFIWHKRVRDFKVKEKYFDEKLKESVAAFYTLKASYDKLERDLLTKPFSLSNSLKHISKLYNESDERAKEEFLKLLRELYFVEKSFIVIFENDEFKGKVDIDDPLFKRVFNKMIPLYLDVSKKNQKSKYLCAIPAQSGKKRFFLVIEKMPFSFFNKDALLEIAVIFTYFVQSLQKEELLSSANCEKFFSKEFSFEFCKLKKIYELYKISSSFAVLRSKNFSLMKRVFLSVKEEKRGIDVMDAFRDGEGYYTIALLFPFSDEKNANKFFLRVMEHLRFKEGLEKDFSNELMYKVASISEKRVRKLLK